MRITLKYGGPPNGTGTVGYRGQDEYSRKFIGRYTTLCPQGCVTEKALGDFIRDCGFEAHVVEILPHRDTPAGKPPECTEF